MRASSGSRLTSAVLSAVPRSRNRVTSTWSTSVLFGFVGSGSIDQRRMYTVPVGGVVPPQDYDALMQAGAEAIFPPGTVIAEAAEKLLKTLHKRLGHGKEAAE